jgi:hypothetical protein
MRIRNLLLIGAICLLGSDASASLINIAEGAPVILNGQYGVLVDFCCGWNPAAPVAAASSLTDGIIQPAATVWQDGSVWWDAENPGSAANSLEIDLGGFFWLRGFSVQADDNDSYRIEVQDAADNWVTVWDIPIVGGFGLQSRPNPADPNEAFLLGSAVYGDRLRFTATGGDEFYSVSEIKAFVPEPGSTGLLFLGLLGLAGAIRSKRR